MAHLLVFRTCRSYVQGDKLIYGTHQQIEQNIDNAKYLVNSFREGYCIPTGSTWFVMDYRVKEEVIGNFAADIGRNLNPQPNNMTLFQVFKSKRGKSEKASMGFVIKLIIWLFKWINKRKTTSIILFFIGLVTLQLWLWVLIPIIIFNPVKPVPVKKEKTFNLKPTWSYDYVFGMLKDPTEKLSDGTKQKDVL